MENLFWIGFVGAVIAGLFAVMQAKKVMSFSEGTDKMKKIAASIREGANAYLKRQYTTVLKVFAVVFVILLIIAGITKNWFASFPITVVIMIVALVVVKNVLAKKDATVKQ